MKDLMKCDCCNNEVESTTTNTCLTSHVELDDVFMLSNKNVSACWDDMFYCQDCLNKHAICKDCQNHYSEEDQIRINKHYEKGFK